MNCLPNAHILQTLKKKGHSLLGCSYAMDKGMLNKKQNLKHILKHII